MKEINLAGQTLQLLSERAAFWKEQRMLIVADLHIGKAATMQHAGVSVPEGSMKDDLNRLKHLLSKTNAERCMIVGDLIHAKSSLSSQVISTFGSWLESIRCPIVLVLGNHDRALVKKLPESWQIELYQEHHFIEPFCFHHYPQKESSHFVISGHLHPQFLLQSAADKLTLRCFYIANRQLVLPAFSDFVGGSYVKKTANSKIYLIAHHEICEL